MFCSNCGAEATGKFCSSCGHPLAPVPKKPVSDTKQWTPAGRPSQEQVPIDPVVTENPTSTADIRFAKVDESVQRRSQSGVAHMEQTYQKDPHQQSNQQINKTVIKEPPSATSGTAAGASKPKTKTKTKNKTKVKRQGRFSVATLLGSGVANILRYLSLLCMTALTLYTAAGFWSQRNALGAIQTIREGANLAMLVYAGLGLAFVIFGVISCLWIYSRRKMADGRKIRHYDTGRGLVSFLFFALLSYFAAVIIVQLPSTPSFLLGIRAAVQIFFVHKTFNLTFSIIGIVCCILRGVKFH